MYSRETLLWAQFVFIWFHRPICQRNLETVILFRFVLINHFIYYVLCCSKDAFKSFIGKGNYCQFYRVLQESFRTWRHFVETLKLINYIFESLETGVSSYGRNRNSKITCLFIVFRIVSFHGVTYDPTHENYTLSIRIVKVYCHLQKYEIFSSMSSKFCFHK